MFHWQLVKRDVVPIANDSAKKLLIRDVNSLDT